MCERERVGRAGDLSYTYMCMYMLRVNWMAVVKVEATAIGEFLVSFPVLWGAGVWGVGWGWGWR